MKEGLKNLALLGRIRPRSHLTASGGCSLSRSSTRYLIGARVCSTAGSRYSHNLSNLQALQVKPNEEANSKLMNAKVGFYGRKEHSRNWYSRAASVGLSSLALGIMGIALGLSSFEENATGTYVVPPRNDSGHMYYKSELLQVLSNFGRAVYSVGKQNLVRLGLASRPHLYFQESSVLFDKYQLGPVIGEGTFAAVKVAKEKKTGDYVAVKEVSKTSSDEHALENEVAILKSIGKHQNIICLKDVYDSADILYIVTDLADGGELFDRIIEGGELSEQTASNMMKEAILAAKHLHDRQIIHLDIKPENLLLADNKDGGEPTLKLADFGLAIQLPGPEFHFVKTECVGTPAYWAPELVKNESFGVAVDIWALGCVLYIILCGSHPFDPYGDSSETEILARVVKGKYDKDSAQYIQISPQAKDLIAHMLDPDASRRYTARQVLSHPWMSHSEQVLSAKPLPLNHMTKLKAFRALQLMRMGLKVQNAADGDDVEGCARMFASFDKNQDGVLSRKEMGDALKRIGVSFNTKEMDELLRLFDANGDGQITKESFLQALLQAEAGFDFATMKKAGKLNEKQKPKNKLQHIKYLFDTIDHNHDGYIEQKDCVHLMDSLGYPDNEAQLFQRLQNYRTMKRKSSNPDKVDFAEFVRFFREMEAGGVVRDIHKKRRMTAVRRVTAKTKSGHKTQNYVPGDKGHGEQLVEATA